eukprot:gene10501-11632_t
MPTHKKGQDRDKYYQLAKDQGYRSRAAFKLIQINKRYDFLTKAKVCIDLCAAPGGWCQVAAKFMPPGSIVLGVDLLPIKPLRGVKTIVGDITTASTRKEIVTELHGWKADAVLCDGAPNIGAAYNKDAFVQNELVLAALKTACEHLNQGGTFVTKVYRSVDYNAIVWVVQQLFGDVQTMKPNSSRSQSSEIFLVCLNYIAPKNIDSRLFDPNHVFQEVQQASKKPDVLHSKHTTSHKKHRSGYDDTLGITLHPTASVSEFILSKEPVRLLSDVMEIKWENDKKKEQEDEEEEAEEDILQSYRSHPSTTEDILISMQDLKVLGKIDFKKLLKWRQLMRETFHGDLQKKKGEQAEKKEKEEGEPVDEETRIQQEISEMRAKQAQVAHREEKKTRKELRKERERQRLGMLNSAFEVGTDQDLFTLDSATTRKQLKELADVDLSEDNVIADIVARESGKMVQEEEDDGVAPAAGLIEILDHDLEDELEQDYVSFLSRRQMKHLAQGDGQKQEEERTLSSKRAAKAQSSQGTLSQLQDEDEELLHEFDEEYEEEEEEEEEVRGGKKLKIRREAEDSLRQDLQQYLQSLSGGKRKKGEDEGDDAMSSDNSDEEEEDVEESDDEERDRRVKTTDAPSIKARTNQWFSNPLFSSTTSLISSIQKRREKEKEEDDDDDDQNLPQMPKTEKEARKEKRKKEQLRREKKKARQDERDKKESRSQLTPLGGFTHEEEEEDKAPRVSNNSGGAGEATFEIVPREEPSALSALPQRQDDRTYDSDSEDYDGQDKLMTLALGTYMLRQSRKKALIDASYNRYAWNDPNGLPSWFVDDEMRHNKPQVPVPQALIDQIKNKYQLTGTKVIKKVAEARARKRKRVVAKLKAAKKQATLMAENSDLSEKEKVKAVAKAARNLRGDQKARKMYVTTKRTKSGSVGQAGGSKGGKLKFVDKRMKKETRAAKASKKRKSRK